MGALKRTIKDHNFYIGIAVGVFVVPMVMGRAKQTVNVKVPSA